MMSELSSALWSLSCSSLGLWLLAALGLAVGLHHKAGGLCSFEKGLQGCPLVVCVCACWGHILFGDRLLLLLPSVALLLSAHIFTALADVEVSKTL